MCLGSGVYKSCLFSSMWSGLLVIPGVSTLPCLPLMLSLKTIILKYFLVCVFLISPCCVHRNRLSIMTFLYLCSLLNNILSHCNPLIFNIWHVVCCSVCNKQSECASWTRPEEHFLLTHSLNNKTNIAPLTLDFRPGLSWSMAQSIFSSSK